MQQFYIDKGGMLYWRMDISDLALTFEVSRLGARHVIYPIYLAAVTIEIQDLSV